MNKKVIGLFKDELGGKIIKESAALGAKTYAQWMMTVKRKKSKEQKRL